MAEVKFIQEEWHRVFLKKTKVASTEDWNGEEVISKEDLETYLLEGTTGDDEKDDIAWQQVAEAECIDDEEPDWWSDRKGCTEIEYTLVDEDEE